MSRKKYLIEDRGGTLNRSRLRYVREALKEHKIRAGSKVRVERIEDGEELNRIPSKRPFTGGIIVCGKSFDIYILFNNRERATEIEWVVESDLFEKEVAA